MSLERASYFAESNQPHKPLAENRKLDLGEFSVSNDARFAFTILVTFLIGVIYGKVISPNDPIIINPHYPCYQDQDTSETTIEPAPKDFVKPPVPSDVKPPLL
jgi:hypothetical protein